MGEGARAAAAEDEADRASAEEARDATGVGGAAIAHVMMPVHPGGVQPGRGAGGAPGTLRVEQDQDPAGRGTAATDDGLERAEPGAASARATSTMRSACRTPAARPLPAFRIGHEDERVVRALLAVQPLVHVHRARVVRGHARRARAVLGVERARVQYANEADGQQQKRVMATGTGGAPATPGRPMPT